MKNFKMKHLFHFLLFTSIVSSFISCSDDESSSSSKKAPVIESVSASVDEDGNAIDLTPITIGYANNMYIIQGSGFSTVQKIYFNDTDTYFNPTLVTDKAIFVTIDLNTPYANASNELRVETLYGTATFDFVVAPPSPVVHSFNPINTPDGGEITIYGNFFLDPIVNVGDDATATIISSTLTEIHATLPAGSQFKKIAVTTISGTTQYGTAVGTAFFDDVFYSPWTIESWNNHEYVADLSKAAQGTTYIKKGMDGWGNIQGNWAWNDQLSGYTGIKFYARSDADGKLKFVFNGDWGETRLFNTTTQWKEYKYTWAQLGNPAAIQNMSFQEFTGTANTYYFDNISFTVD